MYWTINVSLNGTHFFATGDHSISTDRQLKPVLKTIIEKFPESEGYKVTATFWRNSGDYYEDVDALYKNLTA